MSFTEKVKNAQKESKGKEAFTMPFGKYKGVVLKSIPDSYLEYALENFDGLDAMAYGYIKEELLNREIDPRKKVKDDFSSSKSSRRGKPYFIEIPPPRNEDLEAMIGSIFRKLSMRYHPDRGGSDKEMSVVNNLKEEFIKLLKNEGIIG